MIWPDSLKFCSRCFQCLWERGGFHCPALPRFMHYCDALLPMLQRLRAQAGHHRSSTKKVRAGHQKEKLRANEKWNSVLTYSDSLCCFFVFFLWKNHAGNHGRGCFIHAQGSFTTEEAVLSAAWLQPTVGGVTFGTSHQWRSPRPGPWFNNWLRPWQLGVWMMDGSVDIGIFLWIHKRWEEKWQNCGGVVVCQEMNADSLQECFVELKVLLLSRSFCFKIQVKFALSEWLFWGEIMNQPICVLCQTHQRVPPYILHVNAYSRH